MPAINNKSGALGFEATRWLASERLNGNIRPMVDRIIANIHESRTLAEFHYSPLPKLLSGELPAPTNE